MTWYPRDVTLDRHAKTVETLANLGIVVVAALGAAVLAQRLVARDTPHASPRVIAQSPAQPSPPAAAASRTPMAGWRLSVPGLDWNGREQTLILVLSTTCRFCRDSASFYRRLTGEARRTGRTHVVAVFPQPASEAAGYLQGLDIAIDTVVQAPLAAMATRGTPTLILVDTSGTVRQAWPGRLSPERELEVLGSL